jgi:hypothetical protein
MTLAIVATDLWALLLVAMVVMVRRNPVIRHRCCWCRLVNFVWIHRWCR